MPYKIHPLPLRMSVAYLVEGPDGLALVDAGMPGDERRILGQMAALGRDDLRLIYITHAHLDHYGSAAALRRATGAPIAVHRADGPAMAEGQTILGTARGIGRLIALTMPLAHRFFPVEAAPADILLEDGDRLDEYGLPGEALHTPGHTLGSTSLILDGGLAFSGDLVTTTGRPHVQRSFAQDWSLIPTSVARLQAARPDWVYPGHGRQPLSGHGLQQLQPLE